jgi:TPP-dependent indolepyruvate ferredoxin oxidoreductase alpha subunit
MMSTAVRIVEILLTIILSSGICMYFYNKAERKRIRREFIEKRDCSVCKHCGTMNCPNSSLCWSTSDKPYFEPKEEDEQK